MTELEHELAVANKDRSTYEKAIADADEYDRTQRNLAISQQRVIMEMRADNARLREAGKALRDALAFYCHKIGDVPHEIDEWDALVSALPNVNHDLSAQRLSSETTTLPDNRTI